jgi:2-polyprenyl-3-methyl-5-hydroxy-6-metoxy-1,4-benzoquinol methylase
MMTPVQDPVDLVRRGYDVVSHVYRRDTDYPTEYAAWLATLRERLPAGACVLDLGCGCGVPVARALVDHGCSVTGIDLSEVQINRARRLVPRATFHCADATQASFPVECFDAVVSLYMFIHLPLAEQPLLMSRIATWLRPGGWLLLTTGAEAWTGIEDDWLGGGAAMWWSHAGADSYRGWILDAGLTIESEEYVPEGDSGHQLFWARRP